MCSLILDFKYNIVISHLAVTVSTKKEGNKVLVSLQENRSGIPDPNRVRSFKPLFTTKFTRQDPGLDLSMSYDIVKTGCGELKVETTNSGFIFTVIIPIN